MEVVIISSIVSILILGGMILFVIADTRKGERHLRELAQLNALESRRYHSEGRRYQVESEERARQSESERRRYMADHELLMRMILERVDRKKD
jgi:hypothetical protein